MMFTVVGCSFRRCISSENEIENVHLSLQPPGPAANCPLFRSVRLKSTNGATDVGSNHF